MNTELTAPERAKVVEYSRTEAALADLRSRFGNVVFDMRTTAGDKAARTARAEIKGYRTALETMRVDLSAPILERQRVINAEAKRITAELIALEEPIDAQIKADEKRKEAERREKAQAAQRRKDEIRDKISQLRSIPVNLVDATPDRIANAIGDVEAFEVIAAEFDDQTDVAHLARTEVLAKLLDMHRSAVRRAEEAAKLAAERAEFDRLRAEQAERDLVAAAERAEQERIDRERREAEEAQARAEREAEQRKINEQRAEIARQQAAIDAERQRIADEEAARQRAADEAAAAAQRERDEAARIEAARVRAEQEAATAEQKRRERAQFELNGPTADEMVAVLAKHYGVSEETALYWINLHVWAEVEVAA